jgi:5'-nucleotidase/UDP-sugar diphosphatase
MKTSPRLVASLLAALAAASVASAQYSVTILHNNDGESRLTSYRDSLPDYGGVARFATLLDLTRNYYETAGHGVVSIYAGDTFLAGPQFQASLNSGAPGARTFYDALAISRMGYDVSVIGNHEFDFGPDVLAEFISDAQTHNPTTYLSANLDFSGESSLASLVTAGTIAPTKTVTVSTSAGNKTIGIIGVTTETLPFVSSPRNVVVNGVASAINTQIANLQAANVDHIILAGHLQGLAADNALVSQLNAGVDLIIAGGGSELLQNTSPGALLPGAPETVATTGLIPGDSLTNTSPLVNNYPLPSTATDLAGNSIAIVTTDGNYGYLGRVTLDVDALGNISVNPSSNPQIVADTSINAGFGVAPNAAIQAESVDPVAAFVAALDANVLATTSIELKQGGSNFIRSRETNLGNFVADAFLTKAQELAGSFGVDSPVISLVNAGGIRASIATGDVSQLDTFNVSPFGNFLSVVEDVKAADLKLLLENAYRFADGEGGGANGRFAQIGGLSVAYNPDNQGLTFDATGVITQVGDRIVRITVDGVDILVDGVWLVNPETTTYDIATLNFLANGGDQYFRTLSGSSNTYLSELYDFTNLGITDQNALEDYIEQLAGGDPSFDLSSADPDYQYTESFVGGRISAIPEPSAFAALAGLGALGVAATRRRRRA